MKQSNTAFIKTYWNVPTEMLTKLWEAWIESYEKACKGWQTYILRVCMSNVAHYK